MRGIVDALPVDHQLLLLADSAVYHPGSDSQARAASESAAMDIDGPAEEHGSDATAHIDPTRGSKRPRALLVPAAPIPNDTQASSGSAAVDLKPDDIVCTVCEQAVATLYCSMCRVQEYCDDCSSHAHRGVKATHNVRPISERPAALASQPVSSPDTALAVTAHVASASSRTAASRQMCPEHPAFALTLYCESDARAVCDRCAGIGSHKTHTVRLLDEMAEVKRAEVKEHLSELTALVTERLNPRLKWFQDVEANVKAGVDTQLTQLDAMEAAIIAALKDRTDHWRAVVRQYADITCRDVQQANMHATQALETLDAARAQVQSIVELGDEHSLSDFVQTCLNILPDLIARKRDVAHVVSLVSSGIIAPTAYGTALGQVLSLDTAGVLQAIRSLGAQRGSALLMFVDATRILDTNTLLAEREELLHHLGRQRFGESELFLDGVMLTRIAKPSASAPTVVYTPSSAAESSSNRAAGSASSSQSSSHGASYQMRSDQPSIYDNGSSSSGAAAAEAAGLPDEAKVANFSEAARTLQSLPEVSFASALSTLKASITAFTSQRSDAHSCSKLCGALWLLILNLWGNESRGVMCCGSLGSSGGGGASVAVFVSVCKLLSPATHVPDNVAELAVACLWSASANGGSKLLRNALAAVGAVPAVLTALVRYKHLDAVRHLCTVLIASWCHDRDTAAVAVVTGRAIQPLLDCVMRENELPSVLFHAFASLRAITDIEQGKKELISARAYRTVLAFSARRVFHRPSLRMAVDLLRAWGDLLRGDSQLDMCPDIALLIRHVDEDISSGGDDAVQLSCDRLRAVCHTTGVATAIAQAGILVQVAQYLAAAASLSFKTAQSCLLLYHAVWWNAAHVPSGPGSVMAHCIESLLNLLRRHDFVQNFDFCYAAGIALFAVIKDRALRSTLIRVITPELRVLVRTMLRQHQKQFAEDAWWQFYDASAELLQALP